MRQALAKSVRRDLRRAVGVSAIDTMQQMEQAIGSLGNAVNSLRSDAAALARDHATFKKDAHGKADVLGADLLAFRDRPFRARLRWLFTGK